MKIETPRIQEIDKEINILSQKISDLRDKKYKEIDKALDLKGKYFKYSFFEDEKSKDYIYVEQAFDCQDGYFILRGPGFFFEYYPYGDANSATYSAWFEIRLHHNGDESKLMEEFNKLEEITKEEWISKFKEMTDKLYEEGISFLPKD